MPQKYIFKPVQFPYNVSNVRKVNESVIYYSGLCDAIICICIYICYFLVQYAVESSSTHDISDYFQRSKCLEKAICIFDGTVVTHFFAAFSSSCPCYYLQLSYTRVLDATSKQQSAMYIKFSKCDLLALIFTFLLSGSYSNPFNKCACK